MTIETKYNLGDKVWIKVKGIPTEVRVTGIYQPFEPLLFIVENDTIDVALEERYLYQSKEELLKSL